MSDKSRLYSIQPEWHYADFTDDWEDETVIIITCRRTVGIFAGLVDIIRAFNTRWIGSTGGNLSPTEISDVKIWVAEIERSLNMACDAQLIIDELARMADALESMDYKTPEVISISDFIDGMSGIPGINMQELEAFLNILDLLPGLDVRIDPLKYVLDWIWKSQMLSNQYAQSTAQSAIAGAANKGLLVEGIAEGIDLAEEGGDLILEGLQSAATLIPAIKAILDLFIGYDTANPSAELRTQEVLLKERNLRLQEQNVIQTAMADTLLQMQQTMTECVCGGASSGSCCCGATPGQPIFDGSEIVETECEAPGGFDDLPDWWTYSEKYACWVVGVIIEASTRLGNIEGSILDFLQDAVNGDGYSVQELYNRVGQVENQLMPLTVYYNITDEKRSSIRSLLTSHLAEMLDAIGVTGTEAGKDQAISDYLVSPSVDLVSALASLASSTCYAWVYDAFSTADVYTALNAWIEDGYTNGISGTHQPYEKMIDWHRGLINNNLSNIKFAKLPEVEGNAGGCFTPVDPCQGEGS